jgi:hypothetical protein
LQRCSKICQEEIIQWLNDKLKAGSKDYFTRKEISLALYKEECPKVKRALRQLTAYGEIDIHFQLAKKGGLVGGFMPCYRAKEECKTK